MPSGVYERAKWYCEIEGCNRKHRSKGLCRLHYERLPENKAKAVEYQKKYRLTHKKQKKQYRKDNAEKIAKQVKQYHVDHRGQKKLCDKIWLQTPKGRALKKAGKHRRRLLESDLTTATVQRVYEDNIKHYGTLTCYLCFKPIKFGDDALEHSTPLSRGGTNDYENLGIAHKSCNSKKHTKTLKEWQTVGGMV